MQLHLALSRSRALQVDCKLHRPPCQRTVIQSDSIISIHPVSPRASNAGSSLDGDDQSSPSLRNTLRSQ
ncbi:uncharacterized protein N7498_006156 [Penicillium cinerascens]|uniref:Uncharacterized protein n=1 Tax=Penicillium cinerascens TaxID=70096 RepID=A0A9W9MHQ6_9EURO|nr:uncharacterized protein N7498_006156 [Penicillium cinerascens]KAJ5201493.1 hypothetical protein N7498_006156 [Penicillium cinerascens]